MATSLPRSKKPKSTLRGLRGKSGPSSGKLKRLAQSHPPPQGWFDESDNPFEKPSKPSRYSRTYGDVHAHLMSTILGRLDAQE
jgi:hypothetical protein